MRDYVDQLTRQARVVVVVPHRRAAAAPPTRKRGLGLGALALVVLLCLPLLGSAVSRAPDVEWRRSPGPDALPCHQLDGDDQGSGAPTLWVEPTPRTLRAVPGLDDTAAG